jgi:hypothetical protein
MHVSNIPSLAMMFTFRSIRKMPPYTPYSLETTGLAHQSTIDEEGRTGHIRGRI